MKENLRILANAVQVDATDLEVQFRDLQPYASKHMAASEGRLASAECWRLAIKQTEKNRAAHPCDALSAVVQRLLSWSSSSSDVERAFGQAKALSLPGQSEKEDMRSESDALILKHELGNNDRDKVIRAAMSLWRTFMGRPRSSERSDRIDKMFPGSAALSVMSLRGLPHRLRRLSWRSEVVPWIPCKRGLRALDQKSSWSH